MQVNGYRLSEVVWNQFVFMGFESLAALVMNAVHPGVPAHLEHKILVETYKCLVSVLQL